MVTETVVAHPTSHVAAATAICLFLFVFVAQVATVTLVFWVLQIHVPVTKLFVMFSMTDSFLESVHRRM